MTDRKQENGPPSKPLTVFFSAGEPSGDLHGANLIRELKRRSPDLRAVGYGGPQMAEAGAELHADLTALAVMWFARALLNLHKFRRMVFDAEKYFQETPPDAVVLIDYPGFNWWIARKAKACGIPVFYYVPPQIWAWASWRIEKMRKFVDHILCSLPFEKPWYEEQGCKATYVGHPFFDEVRRRPLDQAFLDKYASEKQSGGRLVAILPGSRTQEVTHNLRWFFKSAERIRRKVPNARFLIACFRPHHEEIAQKLLAEMKITGVEFPVDVWVGKTAEIMASADCAMSVSGSVSMELLHYGVPTVILYWIRHYAYFVQRYLRKVKYITLVNLLAEERLHTGDITPFDPNQPDAARIPFPEYLTWEDKSEQIAGHIVEWLTNPAAMAERKAILASLKERFGDPGATQRATDYILKALNRE